MSFNDHSWNVWKHCDAASGVKATGRDRNTCGNEFPGDIDSPGELVGLNAYQPDKAPIRLLQGLDQAFDFDLCVRFVDDIYFN